MSKKLKVGLEEGSLGGDTVYLPLKELLLRYERGIPMQGRYDCLNEDINEDIEDLPEEGLLSSVFPKMENISENAPVIIPMDLRDDPNLDTFNGKKQDLLHRLLYWMVFKEEMEADHAAFQKKEYPKKFHARRPFSFGPRAIVVLEVSKAEWALVQGSFELNTIRAFIGDKVSVQVGNTEILFSSLPDKCKERLLSAPFPLFERTYDVDLPDRNKAVKAVKEAWRLRRLTFEFNYLIDIRHIQWERAYSHHNTLTSPEKLQKRRRIDAVLSAFFLKRISRDDSIILRACRGEDVTGEVSSASFYRESVGKRIGGTKSSKKAVKAE